MTEALQQLMQDVQRLDPAVQDEIVRLVRRKLARLERQRRREEAIARQNAEWLAELPEQLARIERGEHDGPIYHSEEEFLRALGATDVEMAEFERDVTGQGR